MLDTIWINLDLCIIQFCRTSIVVLDTYGSESERKIGRLGEDGSNDFSPVREKLENILANRKSLNEQQVDQYIKMKEITYCDLIYESRQQPCQETVSMRLTILRLSSLTKQQNPLW